MNNYYDADDWAKFPEIVRVNKELAGAFFVYYGSAMAGGIALAHSAQMNNKLDELDL